MGAGNGDFDWSLLPILRQRAGSLDYLFVEPSQAMCRHLRQRMDREPLAGVGFALDQCTFETCFPRQSFDLVLLTQCLYYIPDRASAIGHALYVAGQGRPGADLPPDPPWA